METNFLPEIPTDHHQDGMAFFLGLLLFVSAIFLSYYYLLPLMKNSLTSAGAIQVSTR